MNNLKIQSRLIYLIEFGRTLKEVYHKDLIQLIRRIVQVTRVRIPLSHKKYIDKKMYRFI